MWPSGFVCKCASLTNYTSQRWTMKPSSGFALGQDYIYDTRGTWQMSTDWWTYHLQYSMWCLIYSCWFIESAGITTSQTTNELWIHPRLLQYSKTISLHSDMWWRFTQDLHFAIYSNSLKTHSENIQQAGFSQHAAGFVRHLSGLIQTLSLALCSQTSLFGA